MACRIDLPSALLLLSSSLPNMPPTLPPELLSRIFAFATSHTLTVLAVCSQQFYDIAVPYLYRSIDLARDRNGEWNPAYCEIGPLKRLAALFLRKQSVALHVKKLRVDANRYDDSYPWDKMPKSLHEARGLDVDRGVKEAIRTAAHSEIEEARWLCDFDGSGGGGSGDAVLAILIPALPKLETLDMTVPLTSYVQRMLVRIGAREAPFDSGLTATHLQDICWTGANPVYGSPVAPECFVVSSVRRLFMHHVGSRDFDNLEEGFSGIPSASSNVQHLELKKCRLNSNEVTEILRIPKALQTFIYEIGFGHLAYTTVEFGEIRQALEQQKESLENLWLDYDHNGALWEWESGDLGPMQSFQGFMKLKHLRLATVYVFGHRGCEIDPAHVTQGELKILKDLLPRSLETLHLTHCEDEVIELLFASLAHLLEHKGLACAPMLSAITLEFALSAIEKHREALSKLLVSTRDTGISMRILNNHADHRWEQSELDVERTWGMNEDVELAECVSMQNKRPVYEEIMNVDSMK